jgi:hypothetical protein
MPAEPAWFAGVSGWMMTETTSEVGMAATPGPVGAAPQMSFPAKLWNLFFDPRKTFASVGRTHEWLILGILVSAISIGGYMPIKSIVKESQMTRTKEALVERGLPEEQQAEILSGMEDNFDNPTYLLFVPVSIFAAMFIVAGVLLFVGNILLGGDLKYLRTLNAYAWTAMIVIPVTLVTVPLVMAKGSMDVSLGLGVLTSPDTGAFMRKLLSSFEIFALWQLWLSSVAVSVMANVKTGRAFGAIFVFWFIWVLAQSGLATLGINFSM